MSHSRPLAPEDHALLAQLGRSIRARREQLGLTAEKLAWKADVAKSYLSELEAGKKAPTIPMLRHLAEHLEVEPWLLLAAEPESRRADVLALVTEADEELLDAALELLRRQDRRRAARLSMPQGSSRLQVFQARSWIVCA